MLKITASLVVAGEEGEMRRCRCQRRPGKRCGCVGEAELIRPTFVVRMGAESKLCEKGKSSTNFEF